jgi:hypothetical protein
MPIIDSVSFSRTLNQRTAAFTSESLSTQSEQNELRVLHLRSCSDSAEDDARCHELHISLEAMKRSREAILKLSEHDEADYDSLPSTII